MAGSMSSAGIALIALGVWGGFGFAVDSLLWYLSAVVAGLGVAVVIIGRGERCGSVRADRCTCHTGSDAACYDDRRGGTDG